MFLNFWSHTFFHTFFFLALEAITNAVQLLTDLKVSVKENEVPTEKNSSRASIVAT